MIDVKKVLSALADKKQDKIEQLWVNPASYNNFPAQTITESSSGWVSGKHLSDYSTIIVCFRENTSTDTWHTVYCPVIGKEYKVDGGFEMKEYRRFAVNSNGVQFYVGRLHWDYRDGGQDRADRLIPTHIYGIK